LPPIAIHSDEVPLLPCHSVIDISDALEVHRVAGKLPALVGAVWQGSELAASGAAGVRHAGAGRATVDDRWHLGSETKAMTAALVAKGIDRDWLRFETTLGGVFGSGVHPGYTGVTLEQLLSH
jgi:CubicO group peptidase (beta-lactamase class C family)